MRRTLPCIAVAAALAGCGASEPQPTAWHVQPDPVISPSNDQKRFDADYVSTPKVAYVGQERRIYYTGGVLEDRPGREMFGLADYTGTGDRGSLFQLGALGTYDYDRQWGMGTVLQDGDIWRVWLVGDSDPSPEHVARVGYAASSDGLNWLKWYKNPPYGSVFEDFDDCTTGSRGVLAFAVIKEPSGFYAWYYTFGSNEIRMAYSKDGVASWRQLGPVSLPIAVTGLGNVVRDGDDYYLTATLPDYSGVVIFKSANRNDWEVWSELRPAVQYYWQSGWMAFPHLVRNPAGEWELYYTAAPSNEDGVNGQIGMATYRTIQ